MERTDFTNRPMSRDLIEQVLIFDTTLRDGEQSPGATMNTQQKLQVARALVRLNVDIIEAGFPVASDGDFESVKAIANEIEGPIICALARAKELDIQRAWEAVKEAPRKRIHIFLATSDIHLEKKLRLTRDEALRLAVEMTQLASSFCEDVEFSPEDAVRTDPQFLCEVVEAVIRAGSTTINIPDTVGYGLPDEYGALIALLKDKVCNIKQAVISTHCHNDLGLAVANSLAAVRNGARQVECTINGIGERAGNTSLEEFVMTLKTRSDLLPQWTNINTRQIYTASRLVSDITGFMVQPNKAIVGRNAFSHEAGIHQHGVLADKRTYEIMDAEEVGMPSNSIVLGKHSGMAAFYHHVTDSLGYDVTREEVRPVFERFIALCDQKRYPTDADIVALMGDEASQIEEVFHLEHLQVVSGGSTVPTAVIRLAKRENGNSEMRQAAGIGVGSVDVLFKTIGGLVDVPHTLIDYVVKAVTEGTDSLAEVNVRLSDTNDRFYQGHGTSVDIIEASARAYLQGINKIAAGVRHGRPRRINPQRETDLTHEGV